ncbi:MAG: hypothetical protein ACO1OB_13095, partial [Archangium sp.]
MNKLRLSFLMLGVLGGAMFANCGPSATCSSATCGGCCDATGKCQSGTSIDACGINGETCGRCGANTNCARGTCEAGGRGGGTGNTGGGVGTTGGGSGATGGGAGSTGGGTGTTTCRQIASLPTPVGSELLLQYRTFASNTGFYNFALWGYGTAIPYDAIRVEVVYPNAETPVMPPVTRTFTGGGYQACRLCAVFHEGCDMNVECQKDYLAQQGTLTIDRADRASAGRIVGSASNVRFVEWDLDNDRPIAGGG